ncbi:MAG: crotonobetainyl-CoA--carnitine CoA-transferase [Bacteroidetes bacterium]|nr:MAG: crotonobetainyl-CoA--carnitine CoA-transferase [Bacteroidota bacterium]REK07243.1 MAG: crotonobetainyl-CoA--carnitine CoA-transferase [Bacteroidota bacterium]REK31770.1 MAG: crotonobetainyl-CoA--carnitine CoA-transferase [Bacteroidota bacterium]REK48050.1 MAG: crotonobetainyl-CoA--carnitine CoA-transferase [Bacteroidota bacterium]
MKADNFKTTPSIVSQKQADNRKELLDLFNESPIPDEELLRNLGLYLNPADLRKFLFMNDMYTKNISVHGVIMEFGVRWGQNLSLLQSLRSIYEPFNYSRKIIGFDTWEGFPSVHEKDGKEENIQKGGYSVTRNYETYLQKLLRNLEKESPLDHMQKFELVKGDAIKELDKYLIAHPETIISMAYFDFDIYEPTKKCLELIRPHLTKGSVIGFDELNQPKFPGETVALREAFGLDRYKIQRSPYSHYQSYIIID